MMYELSPSTLQKIASKKRTLKTSLFHHNFCSDRRGCEVPCNCGVRCFIDALLYATCRKHSGIFVSKIQNQDSEQVNCDAFGLSEASLPNKYRRVKQSKLIKRILCLSLPLIGEDQTGQVKSETKIGQKGQVTGDQNA